MYWLCTQPEYYTYTYIYIYPFPYPSRRTPSELSRPFSVRILAAHPSRRWPRLGAISRPTGPPLRAPNGAE